MSLREAVRRFASLLGWDFEENFRFPVFEILLSLLLILVLLPSTSKTMTPLREPIMLDVLKTHMAHATSMFVLLVIGAIFGLTIARSFESRRFTTFLTNPIRRSEALLSRFLVNLLILYIIFSLLIFVDVVVLAGYAVYSPLVYTYLLILLNLLLACSIALAISVLSRSTIITFFGLPVVYEASAKLADYVGTPYILCFSLRDGLAIMMNYLLGPREFERPPFGTVVVNVDMFFYAVLYRLLALTSLIMLSMFYMRRVELD